VHVSEDLAWWRAQQDAADIDAATLRQVLGRLKAWKVQHDADRERQFVPFLKMVWDGVFGDDEHAVVEAIGEIEAALVTRR
jgi:hypothetical protein